MNSLWSERHHQAIAKSAHSTMEREGQFHSVIVVGAGISGLSAARELLPSFPDLLLVEASERLGGRIDQVALTALKITTQIRPPKRWPDHSRCCNGMQVVSKNLASSRRLYRIVTSDFCRREECCHGLWNWGPSSFMVPILH